jgi:hypothetical protein
VTLGRQRFSQVAVVALMFTLAVWVGALPDPTTWRSDIKAAVAEIKR